MEIFDQGKRQLVLSLFIENPAMIAKAINLLDEAEKTLPPSIELYHSLALAWHRSGALSKERYDFQKSLIYFEKALALPHEKSKIFWTDLGQLYLDLGKQTHDLHLLLKAQEAAKHSPFTDLYAKVAIALFRLIRDDEHLSKAIEAIEHHLHHVPSDKVILLEKGEILKEHALRSRQPKFLHLSKNIAQGLLKDKEVGSIAPFLLLIESNVHLSILQDEWSALTAAKESFNLMKQHHENAVETAFCEGLIHLAESLYLRDPNSLTQAIQSFTHSTSINRSFYEGWNHLGIAFSLAYDTWDDPISLERAIKFFKKAIALHPSSQFYIHYALATCKLAQHNMDESLLTYSIELFEHAFLKEKHASFIPSDWLCEYALALDLMGDAKEDETYYGLAIDQFNRILVLDPIYPDIHHRLANTFAHLAELQQDPLTYQRAIVHYKVAFRSNVENDNILLDWGLTLINFAETEEEPQQKAYLMEEAEQKLFCSAKMGNPQAYYQLACYYSLCGLCKEAITWIKKANSIQALPPINELLEDDWLENVRKLDEFHSFLAKLKPDNLRGLE